MILRSLPFVSVLLAALACGGQRASSASSPAAGTSMPSAAPGALARFAGVRVIVLPLQAVRRDTASRSVTGSDSSLVRAFDRAVERALGDRGLATQWSFPTALERAARRNPTYLADPYRLRAGDAVRVAMRKPGETLAEPFASQVRALAGVSDARYSLVPAELRLEPVADGATVRALLRLAVIDTRGAQLSWVGEVAGEPVAGTVDTLFADLARRVADLVVLR